VVFFVRCKNAEMNTDFSELVLVAQNVFEKLIVFEKRIKKQNSVRLFVYDSKPFRKLHSAPTFVAVFLVLCSVTRNVLKKATEMFSKIAK
jgi:hypothetical protein